jgi:glyoxylase-like metal-dependent hydrolase (beta-lactamase superfamily II)
VTDSFVELVRAPNPSAMTLEGTNSYLLFSNDGRAVCIDPGPPMERHVRALLDAAQARRARIGAILVTHGHPDHYPAAQALAQATGSPIYAHARAEFAHDRSLYDGDAVHIGNLAVVAIDAPGHTLDHLVFYEPLRRALFTGDVVLGTGTTVIAPPAGDMRAYQHTLQRLLDEYAGADTLYGGHGPPVRDVPAKLREYIDHRRLRERELLAALARGPQTIPELVRAIYSDVREVLWPAAARQMLAYLIPLEREGRVASTVVARPLTPAETAILNPAWSTIVGVEQAATIEAELGAMLHLDTLRRYELT